jgi:CBS domain-containing protein
VESSQTADDAAIARIRELTQAVEQLLERHVSCPAAAIMRPAVVCGPGDSLEHAANLLWEHDCGALPVVDEAGKVLAMITDRDICMALYIQGRPAKDCSVESAMSSRCYTCSSDESIQGLVELMSRCQVRRLPVVNEAGKLEGIVSLADVARYLDRLSPGHPTRELLVPTLAAVSHPRCGPEA